MTVVEVAVLHRGTDDTDVVKSHFSIRKSVVCLPCPTTCSTAVTEREVLLTAFAPSSSGFESDLSEIDRNAFGHEGQYLHAHLSDA